MLIRLAELMLIKNDIVESITTTLTESRVSFNKLRTMLTCACGSRQLILSNNKRDKGMELALKMA